MDWGTSNVRAWLVDGNGNILASQKSDAGITRVTDGDFQSAFSNLTGTMCTEAIPTLMSGMIGSRQGWVEAPYLPCPVFLDDLASGLLTVPDAPQIKIVPGVHYVSPTGGHDVMRGEEVQIAGALQMNNATDDQLICLPGTHSKWALIEAGKLTGYSTSMTGEVYAALSRHTILSALLPDETSATEMSPVISMAGFTRGLERSADKGGLLHHLFGARANALFDAIPTEDLRGYLSGMLIGHEIRAMLADYPADLPITIVGDDNLAAHYAQALTMLKRPATIVDAEKATLAGLQQILERSQSLQNGK